jgi:hypothetical protein
MIESGLILTGDDADLLKRALSEVKTKVCDESEASLGNTQGLDALVSYFKTVEMEEREKEGHPAFLSLLRKHLVLGTIIGMQGGAAESLIVNKYHHAVADYPSIS